MSEKKRHMSFARSDIFGGAGNPLAGTTPGMPPGNFGITGPGISSYNGENPQGAAAFLNYGLPPKNYGSIALKSVDFIQYQYLIPPIEYDDTDTLIAAGMPVFVTRTQDPNENTTILMTVSRINALAQQQWDEFVLRTATPAGDPTRNPHFDADFFRFYTMLRDHGESALEAYEYALNKKMKHVTDAMGPDIAKFHQMATTCDDFCYLTRLGFWKRINFSGIVINTTHVDGIQTPEEMGAAAHYLVVNVGLAKRVRADNCYGCKEDTPVGAKVWILLTRKYCGEGKYGAFVLQPRATGSHDYPPASWTSYTDESGARRPGHHYHVGVIIEPPERSPLPTQIELANNTGHFQNQRMAYEAHTTLGACYIAVGFKN